jgi:hypothetical protein
MTERKSLRRALNDEFSLSIPVYDENKASLSGVDRVSLEDELIRLRIETNRRNAAMIRNVEGMRDAISHLSSGKDPEEHLHKNANQNFSEPLKEKKTIGEILEKARKRALGGGIPGAAAMATQVFTLMWLRTTMNYQYKNGGSTVTALKTLYSEGGVRRFYRGLGPALFQGPLSRFGDTAANAGVQSIFEQDEYLNSLPIWLKTAAAATAAASWRIFLMPIDTIKTTLQVNGAKAITGLRNKVATSGPLVMYHGALGAATASYAGFYPWFATYNYLNAYLPTYDGEDQMWARLRRNAFMGVCASMVSDCVSNSIRVVKTTRQTSEVALSYPDTVRQIVDKDGVIGLMTRGLGTRMISNAVQAAMFVVIWKGFEQKYREHQEKKAGAF